MGKVFMFMSLVAVGAIGADILRNPAGTTAAAKGIAAVLTPSYKAAEGRL